MRTAGHIIIFTAQNIQGQTDEIFIVSFLFAGDAVRRSEAYGKKGGALFEECQERSISYEEGAALWCVDVLVVS